LQKTSKNISLSISRPMRMWMPKFTFSDPPNVIL